MRRNRFFLIYFSTFIWLLLPGNFNYAEDNIDLTDPYVEVKKDVPFVPTSLAVVKEMIRMASVNGRDILYDLGSGDGRIPITAAVQTGCKAIGIDIDPQRIQESEANLKEAGVNGVQFILGDIFKADVSNATVITMYLLPDVNKRLRPKFFNELRPGTRLVSHAFDMGEWQADASAVVDGTTVYYWMLPANLSGIWEWDNGGGKESMEITQKFQNATGVQSINGESHDLKDLIIKGDNVMFKGRTLKKGKSTPAIFDGKVNGDRLEGSIISKDGKIEWSAQRVNGTSRPIDQ